MLSVGRGKKWGFQARKRHININFLVRLLLGQTQVFSLFYTMEAQFVPGTNPVCPWDNPGAKTSVKPSKSWKNNHFGADVHDPKARTSMTPGGFKRTSARKNFGSRLSLPATEPPDPRRVSERSLKGSLKGSLKRF